jgi:hypothetical protein
MTTKLCPPGLYCARRSRKVIEIICYHLGKCIMHLDLSVHLCETSCQPINQIQLCSNLTATHFFIPQTPQPTSACILTKTPAPFIQPLGSLTRFLLSAFCSYFGLKSRQSREMMILLFRSVQIKYADSETMIW